MVIRRPVVVISGQQTELPPGDAIVGGSVGTLAAGSGLNGGGDLSSTVVTNVSLAPNPSGLIFVDNKYLACDGAAQRTADAALASGNYALTVAPVALASGVAGSSLAATAQASGNAALAYVAATPNGSIETFTAASAVVSGYAVGLDATGKVQSIRLVTSADTRNFGTAVVFEPAVTSSTSTVYDSSNNRIVIAYQDAGNFSYGTAIVGTVFGNSISFGSPVVFESAQSANISATYDSTNNRVVIAYYDGGNSNYGTAIVGTVSGTSISFGTAVVFESASSQSISTTYDLTNNRVVIAYRRGAANYGTAIVGTVSGTSISFGTAVVFGSNFIADISATYNSIVNRIVISYVNYDLSFYGFSIVGTVSGTSISFGTAVAFNSGNSGSVSSTYNSTDNQVVVNYTDNTISSFGAAIVGTVSGTSISFGAPVTFSPNVVSVPSSVYDTVNNRILISYRDFNNSSYGTLIVGTVSGTSISFGTTVVFESATTTNISSAYDVTNNRIVISYRDNGNSDYGTAIVGFTSSFIAPTVSSQNNFIGIAQTTAASGSAVNVRLPGSYDQNNTGLTPGALYYVNPTTSGFTTTATQPTAWSGAVNWGPVGRAVNSTTLLLTDMI